jgi:hypothetical protein
VLTYGGGELAMYADTVSELLSAVIPGYDELPSNENGDEAAFVARYEAAIELANLVQTGLVIEATENDGWSPEQVTEDELNALCSWAASRAAASRWLFRSCSRWLRSTRRSTCGCWMASAWNLVCGGIPQRRSWTARVMTRSTCCTASRT